MRDDHIGQLRGKARNVNEATKKEIEDIINNYG